VKKITPKDTKTLLKDINFSTENLEISFLAFIVSDALRLTKENSSKLNEQEKILLEVSIPKYITEEIEKMEKLLNKTSIKRMYQAISNVLSTLLLKGIETAVMEITKDIPEIRIRSKS